MKNEQLKQAICLAGSQVALAKGIGGTVKQQHISSWILRGTPVPAHVVIPISKTIGWAITPHELRPDIYPHPDDGLPEELRGKQKHDPV